MTTICLCMIVKDEAAVIERCLRSVRPLIDRWVICDTGSADGTPELVGAALAGVPGSLHRRPWVDFGHNRTELMALAEGTADYLLLLDADMTITCDEAGIDGLGADSYLLRHAEDPEYWIKRLVRGDRRWHYVGATHEYITSDLPDRSEPLDAIVVHHHGDGGTRPQKYERDLRLLTAAHERDPDDPRTVFYLAQTLRDLGRIEPAIESYRRRAAMEGWDEETFYAHYQVGVLSARIGRRADAIEALWTAWSRAPHRAEPLCVLASLFRERGEHRAAHAVADRGLQIEIPAQGLFVERWIYEWGLLFEFSIAAYWVGRARAALNACDRLLALPQLPEAHRLQTIENRGFCLASPPDVAAGDRGFPLRHRDTEEDRAVIRKVFTDRVYALDEFQDRPALARYDDVAALGGPPLIVDCGAHIGASSVWFALRHPEARVIAVEPDPANYALLRENAAGLPRIEPVRCTIAARAVGEPVSEAPGITIEQILEMARDAIPFMLKVDLEGVEHELFSSHWRQLARFPVVIVELHDGLLPGVGAGRSFLRWHVAHGRDLRPIGAGLCSLDPAVDP
jgi:tetratricopeptide (TPR) repeat protein